MNANPTPLVPLPEPENPPLAPDPVIYDPAREMIECSQAYLSNPCATLLDLWAGQIFAAERGALEPADCYHEAKRLLAVRSQFVK